MSTPAPRSESPDHILQVALGFMASKTLLSAIELGVFTELSKAPHDLAALSHRLGLHPRSARDFLDSLVALKLIERRNGSIYSNTAAADLYLDRAKPSYIGGLFEVANARLYGFWGSLTEALRTGQPQNEAKAGGDVFATLYSDPARLEEFLKAMSGISAGPVGAIAEKFSWQDYRTFLDIGCAQGGAPVTIAARHPHLRGYGYDLPSVRPVFEKFVRQQNLAGRVTFVAGNFFKDASFPTADVIVMGHILHDWDLEEKKLLLRKAHAALPSGGALIAYDCMIDDDRRENVGALMMSLNMLIETHGGFDYTAAECQNWMREAGFRETRAEHLAGPESMVVAIK